MKNDLSFSFSLFIYLFIKQILLIPTEEKQQPDIVADPTI
jgi:hypothetical protein